ncbi:MAG: transposase [Chloroflexota bacterium]
MKYLSVEASLQEALKGIVPLSEAQISRIAMLCIGILLAGEVHLSKIARFLKGNTQQDSRIRWICRLLQARFLTPELVYQPILAHSLSYIRDKTWHLVIDRTTLWQGKIDLVTISLNYRKRAIPLIWQKVPFGGAPLLTYVAVVKRCVPVIPAHVKVVFHGDVEFGGRDMIQAVRLIGWDFMLAQRGLVHYKQAGMKRSKSLSSLVISRRRSCQLKQVDLLATKSLGGINILAFHQRHYVRGSSHKRDFCYIATSLPLGAGLQRLGRRRWGTEPFYRDYKSSGWHVTDSRLAHPARQDSLLVLLALLYLWSVCFGRWLCKIGQRSRVDAKKKRHLSIFRIGWDWLINQLINQRKIPIFFRLYS